MLLPEMICSLFCPGRVTRLARLSFNQASRTSFALLLAMLGLFQAVSGQSITISSDGLSNGIPGLTENSTLVTIDQDSDVDIRPSVIVGYLNAGKSVTLKAGDSTVPEPRSA
jgi:hypothetical protein